MKKHPFVNLLLWALLLAACNNDKKTSAGKKESKPDNTGQRSALRNTIFFTVDGKAVVSSGWNISRFDFGAGTSVNVTSNMQVEVKTVNININGQKPGVYPLQSGLNTVKTPGVAYGSYKADYQGDMSKAYSFKDGEVVIQSIDTVAGILNLSFHGTAKNSKGETVTITDGKVINGILRPGISKLN
jgi:hypothetical protein